GEGASEKEYVAPGGPSPRVRGRAQTACAERTLRGSIPARAGERPAWALLECLGRVHPRACGGETRPGRQPGHPKGPSPRVRGRGSKRLEHHVELRSIPARAGESLSDTSQNWPPRVHPRACGGEPTPGQDETKDEGPSPRVRGRDYR